MTDDVRQAAERLRSASYTGPLHEIPLAMVEDLLTLRDAMLPYLDCEPVDEEWLRRMGGVYRPNNGFMFESLMIWCSGGGWAAIYGSMKPSEGIPVETRGEVRTLCRVLGVPLNKEGNEG